MILKRAWVWKLIWTAALLLGIAGLLYLALWPATAPPAVNFLAADKLCGVTVNLTFYDDPTLEQTLAGLAQRQMTWVRQPVLWAEIEPEPGQYNWHSLDRLFERLAGDEYRDPPLPLILVLHTSPAWAGSPTSPTSPPVEAHHFGLFARAVAERYGHRVDYYQLWHEPNLSENWGDAYVSPAAYLALLREGALNIRAVDPEAVIINAALAPTLESGPLNLNEPDYLRQLYDLGGDAWFDVVAGQAYGFDRAPTDPPRPDVLNFRRLELLRQVMVARGDAQTPIWATAYGWDVLPPEWPGRPSPWRTNADTPTDPGVQARWNREGLHYARQQWPWLGPVLAIRWDSTGLATDYPARGFAVSENPLLADFCRPASGEQPPPATSGVYPATHASGQYSPGWRSALTLTDIPPGGSQSLTLEFVGSRLDLAVNRGDYRGYLWVTVDGEPANALPTDGTGQSYVVLYDPQRQPAWVTLARNLPPGNHRAVITAEGGWGQWAISGWRVMTGHDRPNQPLLVLLLSTVVAIAAGGLAWQFRCSLMVGWHRLVGIFAGEGPAWPVEPLQVGLLLGTTLAFYLLPGWGALLLLPVLGAMILLRPDLGLALLLFGLSFFQAPKALPGGLTYSLTESSLLLAGAGFGLRLPGRLWGKDPLVRWPRLIGLDWAVLALLALGLVSTLAAEHFGVSMHGWRMLLLGPVLFYFLVQIGADYGPPVGERGTGMPRWVWRLADALLAGAVLHTVIALGWFVTGAGVDSEGVRRLLSPFYASPNNLALFLGRVWPVAVAVTVIGGGAGRRRLLYGLALLPLSLALWLTYSRGALLLGLPLGVVVMGAVYLLRWRPVRGRWAVLLLGGAGLVAGFGLLLLRFRVLVSAVPGSSDLARLNLWRAALQMAGDHWLLGVGVDNFLLQYRSHYHLPQAWYEPELSHPHNLLLDFATRLGIGGVLLLLWLQVTFWSRAWRLIQRMPEPLLVGLMGSMAVFIGHGLVDNAYFLTDLAYVFFLTMGIVRGLRPEIR